MRQPIMKALHFGRAEPDVSRVKLNHLAKLVEWSDKEASTVPIPHEDSQNKNSSSSSFEPKIRLLDLLFPVYSHKLPYLVK